MSYKVKVLRGNIITVMQVGPGERWNRDFAKRVERTARAIAPKRSGRLAASHVTLKSVGSNAYVNRYRVSAQAYYSTWVHQGTGIYGPRMAVIRSRKGREMGPIPGPGPRFIRYSKGQRPQPWLDQAAAIETALI